MGGKIEKVAVEAQDRAQTAIAQPDRGTDDGVEHRLDVGG